MPPRGVYAGRKDEADSVFFEEVISGFPLVPRGEGDDACFEMARWQKKAWRCWRTATMGGQVFRCFKAWLFQGESKARMSCAKGGVKEIPSC